MEKMTSEMRLAWVKKSDGVADKLMDAVDTEPMGIAHLALTKALCYVLDAASNTDKSHGVALRNFSAQAINRMWESGKPPVPHDRSKDDCSG